jgi:hypothetical protein
MEYYRNYGGEIFIIFGNEVHRIGKVAYAPFRVEFCKLLTFRILQQNQETIRYERNNKSEYVWKFETREDEISEFYNNVEDPRIILNFLRGVGM